MNLRTTGTVIAREYTTRVKKKSFILTTFLVPLLFAGMMVAMVFIMNGTKERKQSAAVVDKSGIVMPYLVDNERVTYSDYTQEDPNDLKTRLDEIGKDVLVVISPLDTATRSVTVQTYSKDPLGMGFTEGLASKVEDAVEEYRIGRYGIENLGEIMESVKSDIPVKEYTLGEDGKENISESGIYMIISMFLGLIIYMFIALFGGQVMNSVIEEKSSRVVEVLISSVKAEELLFGKVIGVAMVALTQFLMWVVLTVVLVTGATSLMGEDMLKGFAANPEMMSQTMGISPDQMGGLGANMASADTTAVAAEPDEVAVIWNTLANVPWARLLICFVVYFLLGYLLYASLFAAVGSAGESAEDTQQLQLPLTVPLMVAYFILFIAFQNPDSPAVVWGSIIPFTSPIVMLARIPFGVPAWQLILSVVLLILTFFACAWLSAKIYKVGILMFGKKSSFKDLWKWLKQK